jgi:hypothetical protein
MLRQENQPLRWNIANQVILSLDKQVEKKQFMQG